MACALGAAWSFAPADPIRLIGWILMAVMLATLKLRIPGITATVSAAAVVIFAALCCLSFGENVIVGACAALSQCYINTLRRPAVIQVAFSAAATAISTSATFMVCRMLASNLRPDQFTQVIVLGAVVYFVINTVLVAGILALTEDKPLQVIWSRLYLWSLPHYIISAWAGILLSYAVNASNRFAVLALLPAIFLVCAYASILGSRLAAREHARA